ncbi:MAG: outer membrane beta-barrel protein [Bacteroidales bacterium]|nr:outer membrane beta-barrel protein [Bacteroidales bacterium]
MKRFLYVLTTILVSVTASAQQNTAWKRLESNFQLGGGLFLESGYLAREENPGAVIRLSYGLDIRVNDQWSVMPGAGLRAQLSQIDHFMAVGNDPDGMSLADIFVTARYHFDSDGTRMVVGLGPALSFMTSADTYYVDADPSDPLNGKEKFKRYDIGLQPSITFLRGKHFQWGFEGSIGLLNAMRQYPEYNRTGSVHLHYLAVTCGWHF